MLVSKERQEFEAVSSEYGTIDRGSSKSDINDPNADIQETGNDVTSIYNQRIDQARSNYCDTRLGVFIRNMQTLEYSYFERALTPFSVNDFMWRLNKNQNLEAFNRAQHQFTWQPHGSQLTMIESVPASAVRFRLNQRTNAISLPALSKDVEYTLDWFDFE